MAKKHKIHEAIKELEQTVSKTPASWQGVAKQIGVARSTLRRWRTGQSIPKEKYLEQIKKTNHMLVNEFPQGTLEERHSKSLLQIGWDDNEWYVRRGRKSLFRKLMYDEGQRLAGLGLVMEEIADFWNINRSTLNRWAKNKPDFKAALKKGRIAADVTVEKSLFKRAIGYEFVETHYKETVVGRGATARTIRYKDKEVAKLMAADVTAQIFWLKNRRPEKWRDDRGLSLFGPEGEAVSIRFVEEKPNRKKDPMPPPINNSVKEEETK